MQMNWPFKVFVHTLDNIDLSSVRFKKCCLKDFISHVEKKVNISAIFEEKQATV